MRFTAQKLSHRRRRIHRLAVLWLKWFAAFLVAAAEFAPLSKQVKDIAHGWLDWIETLIVSLAIIGAGPHVRRIARGGFIDRTCRQIPPRRAIVGSRLRRRLRCTELHARIAALSQSIDKLIAHILRRIPRGLTRRRPVRARAERAIAPPLGLIAEVEPLADTS